MRIFHRVSQTRPRKIVKRSLECGLYLQFLIIWCQNVEDKENDSSSDTEINY